MLLVRCISAINFTTYSIIARCTSFRKRNQAERSYMQILRLAFNKWNKIRERELHTMWSHYSNLLICFASDIPETQTQCVIPNATLFSCMACAKNSLFTAIYRKIYYLQQIRIYYLKIEKCEFI